MKRLSCVSRCLAILLLALWGTSVYSQQSPAPAQSKPAVKAKSEEVLLDVVVRDKKGHPVNNLSAKDFQIFDNGQPKKIDSFRLITGKEAVVGGSKRQQLDPLRQVRLVTMVFHCNSNAARGLARGAAFDLLKSELPQNVYMSVMVIDHKLEVIQPFTNDLNLLKKAVRRATGKQSADFSKDTDAAQSQLETMLGPATNGEPSAQGQISNINATLAAQGQNVQGSALANVAMAQMVLQMIRTEQSATMAEAGRTEIWSLLDAVKEQYRLPGRKTLLYFSEGGFAIPQGMEAPFKDVISIANRSNVSVYAVDTQGLVTSYGSSNGRMVATGQNQAAIDALSRAAQASRDQQANNGSSPVRRDEAALFDTSIESTRANAQNTLATLADSTGGVLIANTNDLRAPLRRLSEDIETYYEITYSPDITHYDGAFHKISVKLQPSDLKVQSRSGYFAMPPELANSGTVLLPYEVPLVKALNTTQPPEAFPFHAAGLHYRGDRGLPECNLVVDVPLSDVTLTKQSNNQYLGRLSYVALVKNAKGEVVKKFGNDIPLNVPSAKLTTLKASHFIYSGHFALPPGHYTIESAVLDGAGNRVSTRKSSLVMLPSTTALGISSVAIIRSTRDAGKSPDPSDPLLIGTKVISPTISPVISKATTQTVSFYVVVYPDKSVAALPHLTMEFSRNGELLGRGSPQLGPPDKDGRIEYVATAPLAALNPGDIGIRFIVTQGSERAEESVSFELK